MRNYMTCLILNYGFKPKYYNPMGSKKEDFKYINILGNCIAKFFGVTMSMIWSTDIPLPTCGLSVKYWMLSLLWRNRYQKTHTKVCIGVCTLLMIGRWTWIVSWINTLLTQRWKVWIQQQHIGLSLLLSKTDSIVGGTKLFTLENDWQWMRFVLWAGIKNDDMWTWTKAYPYRSNATYFCVTMGPLATFKLYALMYGSAKDDNFDGVHDNTLNLQMGSTYTTW